MNSTLLVIKQAILGVLFHGIKKLSDSPHRPNKQQILKWYATCSFIEQANRQAYKDASALTTLLQEKYGVHGCVLKGQTNALMYPDPYMRTSGDIDLWTDAKTLDIIRISRQLDPKGEIGYHHIELSYFKTPVEVHFFPSFYGKTFGMSINYASSLINVRKSNLNTKQLYQMD